MGEYQTGPKSNEYVLKPKLIFWLVVLPILPISIFLSVWATGFFGGFLFVFFSAFLKIKLPTILVYISPVILFILINLLFIWMAYGKAKKMEYHFFNDRIEYYEGFLAVEKKVIYYNRITNIGLRKGMFQKKYNLGSIYIDTAGSSPKGHELTISWVEQPDKWYEWLSQRVNKQQR